MWVLPFYPSPLRDDGYDIADYTAVHADYGTLHDFERFLSRAHELGLRVITELVVNHTSDQHAWFRRAQTAPRGSRERDFYVWSDSPERYRGARIIFPDFERSNWSWDPIAAAYYWHRFYSHQPDLNYENPEVFDAVTAVLDYWFGLGVDGMRLDAVPYLIEREGTHSENLGATHEVVKRLRAHIDRRFANRIFIAEANQWPEDAAAYFGNGDESHMVFHFPLMPRLFMAIRQEDRLPIADILAQTPPAPAGCQWTLFLRNHDELTLEMVTEEERLYMYQVYATEPQARVNLGIRRRLAPLLGNDRRRIELMNALLFSLQGTPVVYYGDEIGMGDNVYLGDRNGVRTPMQWSGDRNAGFSDANPQRLFLPLIIDDQYHHQSVHVAQQQRNPHSLLWWMKRLIAMRKRYQAFGRGQLTLVECANTHVLAFLRQWGDQRLLVIANLSRFVQRAELPIPGLEGAVPVEVFGRVTFPPIRGGALAITLGPHGFIWFELTRPGAGARPTATPRLEVDGSWEDLLGGRGLADLETVLPQYVERCGAWSRGLRPILSVRVEDAARLTAGGEMRWLAILRVSFASGEPERYLLPLGCRTANGAGMRADVIAHLRIRGSRAGRFELFDAGEDPVLAGALLEHLASSRALAGTSGRFEVVRASDARARIRERATGVVRRTRPSTNAVHAVGREAVIKLFRVVEPGINPEIEVRTHLRRVGFRHSPRLVAAFRWSPVHDRGDDGVWLGILQEFVRNEGEAWAEVVRVAREYMRRRPRGRRPLPPVLSLLPASPWGRASDVEAGDPIAPSLEIAARLGKRTAELHRALSVETGDESFDPEPFSAFSRRSAYQRMRSLAVSVIDAVRASAGALDPDVRDSAAALVERRAEPLALFRQLLDRPMASLRIRCHGNLHLGQFLRAGRELVIIDFDGEPGRPLYERRLKRSPLHDVATTVRSFHNAAHAVGSTPGRHSAGGRRPTDAMRVWQQRVGAAFVDAYATHVAGTPLLPDDPEETRLLFHCYILERALYEVGFELNRRSRWVRAPLLDLPLLLAPHDASTETPSG